MAVRRVVQHPMLGVAHGLGRSETAAGLRMHVRVAPIQPFSSPSTSVRRHLSRSPRRCAIESCASTSAYQQYGPEPPLVWAGRTEQHDVESGFFTPSSSHERTGPSGLNDKHGGSSQGGRVSDHEYEVRVGRAYDLLRATLPDFLRIGLVDYDHHKHGSSPSSMTLLDALAFRNLRTRAIEEGLSGESFLAPARPLPSSSPMHDITLSGDQVYHPSIHFRFCANGSASSNVSLTEEEAASLSFSGRSLYFASAHVLRHTLNVLFADAHVAIESIRREKKGKICYGSKGVGSMNGSKPLRDVDGNGYGAREDVIYIRIGFIGHLRVTGAEHRYTLVFRYDFDPDSGRIARHTVERIEPAIGRKVSKMRQKSRHRGLC